MMVVSIVATRKERKLLYADFLCQGNVATRYCGLLRLDPSSKSLRINSALPLLFRYLFVHHREASMGEIRNGGRVIHGRTNPLFSLPNAVASSRSLFVPFSLCLGSYFLYLPRPGSIYVEKPLRKQGHKYLRIIRVF